MKKKLIISFILLLLVTLLQAQTSIYYLNNTPDIDGLADDWDMQKAKLFQSKAKNVYSVNQARYILGFDEQNLYGLFQITDRHLTDLALDKSGSPRLTFNDAIELYIDAKNNSRQIMDASDYQIIIDLNSNITVFRGGDRFLVQVDEALVPKDTITANFVIDVKTTHEGSLNNGRDIDNQYIIEFRLPWASLGVVPIEGEFFKMDICFNDADEFLDIKPLSEGDPIPHYSYESITGNTDFGYPDKWTKAKLVGHLSWWKKLNEKYGHYWWILSLIIILIFIPAIVYLSISNTNLRHIQPKSVEVDRKLGLIFSEEDKQKKQEINSEKAFVKNTRRFILQQLDNDITPADLASELGISIRQLQRIFKEELDITPNAFITTLKMEAAASMLQAEERNISEVAYAIGFSDPAYFAKVFKKYFRQSPKEYIKNKT
ncbi:helix-turn-helix domain-containing protein [Emticicia sp. BO119]|uniref:helix-turn-helix domain-containing protein n=1 Tax=Emticicia sp. BO119 TaxID=2757768 RepID=UPI0015F0FBE2|nr:helix-turn-helix domain-containing protein [Emticicia sp. BO119]MBA4850047.1 helix-turn-helix domain-containing protein [Emticicia sp. BO119]